MGRETKMCMLDEIRARCACREAVRSPEVAKQRAATRSQEAARDEIYAIARKHKAEKLWVFGSCAREGQYGGDELKEVCNG